MIKLMKYNFVFISFIFNIKKDASTLGKVYG